MVEEAQGVPSRTPTPGRRRAIAQDPHARRKFRIAMVLIGLFGFLTIGILISGYIVIFVRPPAELVVRVNDVRYSRGDMVKLLRIRQKGLEYLGQPFNAGEDVFQGLQLLVENEIITQAAPSLGISVTTEEVEAELRGIIFQTRPPSPGTPIDQIEREFQERYGAYLNNIQVSDDEHRDLVRRSLLREKVRQFIGDSVPTVAEQVRLHRISMDPQGETDIMQVKLKDAIADSTDPAVLAGAFRVIAREFSVDHPELVRNGGDLGWVPKGVHNEYDYAFFDLEIGKLSEAIPDAESTRGNMFFFMVSERATAREVDEVSRDFLKTRALQDWLNRQRDNFEVYAVFNSEIYNWIIEQLQITTSVTPEPQPQFQNPLAGF